MPRGKRKDSVSVNAYIGKPLLDMLEAVCLLTGQSKTVAVERAISMHCAAPPGGPGGPGQTDGGSDTDTEDTI